MTRLMLILWIWFVHVTSIRIGLYGAESLNAALPG